MKKVLVIDDSKTVRSYHKDILKNAGYEVEEAENGIEAIKKSLHTKFNLFLVDANMPVMDGYSFIEEIRKKSEYKLTSIIMISTESEDIDKNRAYISGANIYYIKPVKSDVLKSSSKILIA